MTRYPRIMVSGRMGRGKDELFAQVQSVLPEALRIGFADSLKSELAGLAVQPYYGNYVDHKWVSEMLVNDRSLMGPGWQWWGNFRRQVDVDHWVKLLAKKVNRLQAPIVVTDCRFDNEVEYGRRNGFIVVRITGPDHRPGVDTRSDQHPSEANVDNLNVHLEYANTGTKADMREWVEGVLLPLAQSKATLTEGAHAV